MTDTHTHHVEVELHHMPESFGTTLRTIREEIGLTTELVAFRAGFTSTESIIAYENGANLPPHMVMVGCIMDAMQCTTEEQHRLVQAYIHSTLEKHGLTATHAIQRRYTLIE